MFGASFAEPLRFVISPLQYLVAMRACRACVLDVNGAWRRGADRSGSSANERRATAYLLVDRTGKLRFARQEDIREKWCHLNGPGLIFITKSATNHEYSS